MRRGYTLIELLVAISIFSLVVAGVTGFFVSALRAQRKALASREIIDSASYVLNYMADALRMAKKNNIEIRGITKNCSGIPNNEVNYIITYRGQGIKFRNYKINECQEFFLESASARLKKWREGIENYLTPDDLEIRNLRFFLSGDNPGDTLQPRVTILLEIQKRNQPETIISAQTTISQRDLDL
jgi:prepilin-type N-terminal cleavage/methylation domain-containing protein